MWGPAAGPLGGLGGEWLRTKPEGPWRENETDYFRTGCLLRHSPWCQYTGLRVRTISGPQGMAGCVAMSVLGGAGTQASHHCLYVTMTDYTLILPGPSPYCAGNSNGKKSFDNDCEMN